MKVLNPFNVVHEIVIVPRYYTNSNVNLVLKDELTSEVLNYTVTPITIDGYMYLNFEESFINNTNYQLTINEGLEVVYRGKIFVTDQANDTQNYKITKDTFQF